MKNKKGRKKQNKNKPHHNETADTNSETQNQNQLLCNETTSENPIKTKQDTKSHTDNVPETLGEQHIKLEEKELNNDNLKNINLRNDLDLNEINTKNAKSLTSNLEENSNNTKDIIDENQICTNNGGKSGIASNLLTISNNTEVDKDKNIINNNHKIQVEYNELVQPKKYIDEEFQDVENNVDLRQKLEDVLKLMLLIWCRENKALELLDAENKSECDKTIIVHRDSGEFGFRIHGSKPVVVSAIEPNTPAETSGLEVGDIVLAVNGVSVLDKSHSEVVKIAHAGSDTLKLEVARTCYALNTNEEDLTANNTTQSSPLCSGYLWKLSGYASGVSTNKWIRRWFCLKPNNCLYYYKTDTEKQPVGVLMLFDQEVKTLRDDDNGLSKPYRFVIQRQDGVPLHLAADTANARNRWVEVLLKSISDSQIVDEFVEETKRNLMLCPNAISQPDCFGYLIKLGTQWKSWSRRYCVLKDACLYFYQDANAKNAFGVAYLHGYRVQQASGSKKHAFEILPPDPDKKHFYFHTESDADRKRWIAALEYSIDRWLKIT